MFDAYLWVFVQPIAKYTYTCAILDILYIFFSYAVKWLKWLNCFERGEREKVMKRTNSLTKRVKSKTIVCLSFLRTLHNFTHTYLRLNEILINSKFSMYLQFQMEMLWGDAFQLKALPQNHFIKCTNEECSFSLSLIIFSFSFWICLKLPLLYHAV